MFNSKNFSDGWDRVFKRKSIKQLVGMNVPIYAKFDSVNIPNIPDKRNPGTGRAVQSAWTLSDPRVKITSIQSYKDDLYHCGGTEINGRNFGTYLFSDSVSFYLLEDEELSKTLEIFDRLAFANLHAALSHSLYSGTDQSFFVEDKDGKCIPAPLLGLDSLTDYGTIRSNTHGMRVHTRPNWASCLQGHHNCIAPLFQAALAATQKFPGSKLSIKTVVPLPEGTIPETFMQPVKPHKNAYGLTPKDNPGFQVSESHYHFSGVHSSEKAVSIVKGLDAIMGIACVSLLAKYDDPQRRLACLPGDYDIKGGGGGADARLEYRALSNAWMCHPMIYYLVADTMRKAYMMASQGYDKKFWNTSEDEVVQTMLNSDVDQARKILLRNKECLLKIIRAAYPGLNQDRDGYALGVESTNKRYEVLFNVFLNGIETAIKDPSDVANNWMLSPTGSGTAWSIHYGKMVRDHIGTLVAGNKVQ